MQASEVDNHIKRQIQALKGTSRDNIRKRFQEGFKGYTVDTFKLAHRITLRDLHNLLVSYGVPVDTPRRNLSCADALQACLEKKLPEEPTLPPKPQPTNRALLDSANQAVPQLQQYSQPQSQYQASSQPQVQPQSQYQAPYVQSQASQRSVHDDDDNWSWPSNKQETSESHEQPDFSYEVNDDEDDSQSEGEDWDDDDYSNDYGDSDYE
ncbi:hypothetical protein B0O99DRAFT_603280 [Bisporella sp. PMI_857]|nr:hypothetical protein B0O99DRAFT_603280 [Bisporella sp. PMI_857]